MGEVKKQSLTMMTAALGFVAALVWKDAILAWMAPLLTDGSGAVPLTIAAVIVTVVVIIVLIVLTNVLGEK